MSGIAPSVGNPRPESAQTGYAVSVLLPVMNETASLQKTVDMILQSCSRKDLKEFIILVSKKTSAESLEVSRKIAATCSVSVRIHEQSLPFLGGAIREGFQIAKGSHVVMMASDLETDPALVETFIEQSKSHPDAIITASRWIRQNQFAGYNRIKLVLNFVFQKLFSGLYFTRLSDMTYGYRLFPAALIKSIRWDELRHPFLFETILKPLRMGVKVIEVPAQWSARSEGTSQNTFLRNFEYFRIGWKVRFQDRRQWQKPHAVPS